MKERTYGWAGYFAFISVTGVNITTFTLGSSYIAYGLTAGQTLGMVFLETFISGSIAFISARPGLDRNMGYVSSDTGRKYEQVTDPNLADHVPSYCIWSTRGLLSNWHHDNNRIRFRKQLIHCPAS
jgi:hypothetical protein